MIFRKANSEDIPQIVLIWREMADMHAAWQPIFELGEHPDDIHVSHVKALLAKDNCHLIVAEDGNKIAAYSTMVLANRPDVFLIKRSASIQDTCVKSEYRHTGIGRQLTQKMIDIAKENGAEMISLGVAVDNEVGNKFWKEMGFKPTINQMAMYLG